METIGPSSLPITARRWSLRAQVLAVAAREEDRHRIRWAQWIAASPVLVSLRSTPSSRATYTTPGSRREEIHDLLLEGW